MQGAPGWASPVSSSSMLSLSPHHPHLFILIINQGCASDVLGSPWLAICLAILPIGDDLDSIFGPHSALPRAGLASRKYCRLAPTARSPAPRGLGPP